MSVPLQHLASELGDVVGCHGAQLARGRDHSGLLRGTTRAARRSPSGRRSARSWPGRPNRWPLASIGPDKAARRERCGVFGGRLRRENSRTGNWRVDERRRRVAKGAVAALSHATRRANRATPSSRSDVPHPPRGHDFVGARSAHVGTTQPSLFRRTYCCVSDHGSPQEPKLSRGARRAPDQSSLPVAALAARLDVPLERRPASAAAAHGTTEFDGEANSDTPATRGAGEPRSRPRTRPASAAAGSGRSPPAET